MRGFSQEVEDEFNFGTCTNLKKDIRPFGYPTEFTFYIMHDSIGVTDSVYLGWDTSTLNYEVGDFWIAEVSIFTYYGYIEGIDGTSYTILHRLSDSTVWFGYVPVPIYSLAETLPCFNNDSYEEYLMKITTKVYFKDFGLDVNSNYKHRNTVSLYPNPVLELLHIQSQYDLPLQAEVYDIYGNKIDMVIIESGVQQLDVSSLSSGNYYIKIISENTSEFFTYKFIKL